jgi:TRAP-type C4-dicarboxylate transport system substrate-binding protein
MKRKKMGVVVLLVLGVLLLGGCQGAEQKQIIRIGHNQSTNHPTHIALVAFRDYINEHLGDKYIVEVYPNELLGSQTDMVQLTQTGAIDYCVASNAILETIFCCLFFDYFSFFVCS